MEVVPSSDRLEELQSCFVGVLSFFREAIEVQHSLVLEGLNEIRFTSMGDDLVLIQSEIPGEIERARVKNEKCWKATFKEVKRWSLSRVARRRRVWLRIYGIPLHVWDEPFFKVLGSKFGTFLDFDEDTVLARRLDVARIQVSTTRMGFIDEQLRIVVVGANYSLWVVEEGQSVVKRGGRVERHGEEVESEASFGEVEVVGAVLGEMEEEDVSGDEVGGNPLRSVSVRVGEEVGRSEGRPIVIGDMQKDVCGLNLLGFLSNNTVLEEVVSDQGMGVRHVDGREEAMQMEIGEDSVQILQPRVQVATTPAGVVQEDWEGSDYSDSLGEIPDDQVLLTHLQKQRFKRKQGKNNFNSICTPKFLQMAEMVRFGKGGTKQISLKSGKSFKKGAPSGLISSTSAAQEGQDKGVSGNLSSGIQFLMEDNEVVPKTQLDDDARTSLKDLAASKLLSRQKEAGFSHETADDLVTGRLVLLEEVDVKTKVGKGKSSSGR